MTNSVSELHNSGTSGHYLVFYWKKKLFNEIITCSLSTVVLYSDSKLPERNQSKLLNTNKLVR